MKAILGVLLAGGLGRRIGGGDKPLRVLDGRTLLDHAIACVRPQVAALVLNANGDPARFAGFGLPVVPDTLTDTPGPLAGVLAGMRWAAAHTRATEILSVPTDTPFLPADLAARLMSVREGRPVALAASAGRTHPVAGLWSIDLANALEAFLRDGHRKVEAFTAQHDAAVAEFAATPRDPFFNVNTPEDLAEAERMLRA